MDVTNSTKYGIGIDPFPYLKKLERGNTKGR